nr:transposase [Rhodococcus sp. WB9]
MVLAIDISPWLRPDAPTSSQRAFCHVYGRGRNQAQLIPGWPYSFVAALEVGRTSWTAVLDAVRLRPDDDETTVTTAQVREVVGRLQAAGHWSDGDPDIVLVFDAGYELARMAFLLADLPVQVLGRMRSDRVLHFPAPPAGRTGRPPRHGAEFKFADSQTWPEPDSATDTDTDRYGRAVTAAWNRLHPRITHRGSWADHPGFPPIVEGTVIRLTVDHLPGDRHPKPVWLWYSHPGAGTADIDRLWQMFLRRFDIEHTFRLFRQTIQADVGLDRPEDPQPRGGRPMDVDRPDCAHPTPARPAARRRPTPSVGTTRPTATVDAGPRPSRVSAHPRDHAQSCQCTETQSTWSRTPTRLEEPPPRPAPSRRETHENRHHEARK